MSALCTYCTGVATIAGASDCYRRPFHLAPLTARNTSSLVPLERLHRTPFSTMDFLKSAVASIAKGPAFPYTFGDRVDIDQSIWTLHNGTRRVRGPMIHETAPGPTLIMN